MLILSYRSCHADDVGVAPRLQAMTISMRGASYEKIVVCLYFLVLLSPLAYQVGCLGGRHGVSEAGAGA